MGSQGILISVVVIFLGHVYFGQSQIRVGITHWGDVRSHLGLMQKDDLPNDCKAGGTCVGGIPQLLAHIKDTENKYHADAKYKLRFATGNLVSGETGYLSVPDFGIRKDGYTPNFAQNGWETFGKFLDSIELGVSPSPTNYTSTTYYKPNYMSLGIKEFESGISALGMYLAVAKTTTIVSNVNTTDFDLIKYKMKNYAVHDFGNDIKIGVVGFVNPLANSLADADPLYFLDPTKEIPALIEKTPALRDLKTVIAVGTGNYNMAKSIIANSRNVKLVIYGGGTKDLTKNYPAKEVNGKGYIATAGLTNGVATKLGALTMTLSNTGELVSLTGSLREVDTSIPQDDIALNGIKQLTGWSSANQELSQLAVNIDGGNCWKNECNLGNLMTDAMVHCAHESNKTVGLGHDFISVWHGGAFFRDVLNATDKIKVLDIHKWLPYHNNAFLVKMTGKTLKKMFEKSATALNDNPAWGQFLQVSSGMEVTYNDKKFHKLRTIHYDNGIPKLKEVSNDAVYTVVIPSIIYDGKTVYTNFRKDLLPISTQPNSDGISLGFDDDCLTQYLATSKKITIGFEERIFMDVPDGTTTTECNKKTGLTVFLTLFITALLVGSAYATWHFFIQPRRENNNFCC